MKRTIRLAAAALALIAAQDLCHAQYFKDIFQDSGINLTSRQDLPAARYLGLSIETYYSATHKAPSQLTMKDTIEQTAKMVHSDADDNGCLLYPDGAPRYRMIYMNGGQATKHGNSLTEAGRQHIRDFVANGGSYVGTCAGAYISSINAARAPKEQRKEYLGIYPGFVIGTVLSDTTTGHFIEPNSPLLKYYDFGGDNYVAEVYHNGGCFMNDSTDCFPEGTEILCRYDYNSKKRPGNGYPVIHNRVSGWAYKASAETGRVVVLGSHPEGVTSGERLDLFSAMCLYALDGQGNTRIKAQLENGKARIMNKDTKDNDPAFTKIGDKQYHHYTVNIPEKAKNIKVKLESPKDYIDFNLTMKKGGFAFLNDADYKDITLGANKSLEFATLPEGEWYIGVQCATTVEEVKTDCGIAYTGKLEVLNGIPYTITVTWDK